MSEVYRDGYVHVREQVCDHCLLGPDRLVSGARAREIIASTRSRDAATFLCHRGQITDESEAICRSWFDAFGDEDWIMRLAVHLDKIKFV